MAANAGENGAAAVAAAVPSPLADGEWTRIVRKKGKGINSRKKLHTTAPPPQPPPPAAGPVENFQPNAAPKLSVADIAAEHANIGAKWRASSSACYVRLRALIQANAAASSSRGSNGGGCVAITRAICLGLGAFDPADGSWVARRRSHVQLAAFLAMVEALEEATGGGKIECLYQEPRFTQPDKEFIASLGGKVVESPASYALVDDRTMVYGVHLYRDIWAAALERSLPGVFIGTGWDVWEDTGAGASGDFDCIREMDASPTFDKIPFPQDDDPGSFSSTCIYWRRREPEEDGIEGLGNAVAALGLEPRKETGSSGVLQ
ncbi:unnamed protein product [Discula destructiva]